MSKSGGASRSSGGAAARTPREPQSDRAPFSPAAFTRATLTPLTGAGGHMRVFTTTIDGANYFAKGFRSGAHGAHERPEHDQAARTVARIMGLGEHTLPIYRLSREGETFIVSPFVAGRSAAQVAREDGVSFGQTLHTRLSADTRARLALFAYVIADGDRISPNFFVERQSGGRVLSIDHTRSFYRHTAVENGVGKGSPLLRHGIGQGARVKWQDVAIPRAELERAWSARGRILTAVRAYGLDSRPVTDRLSVIHDVLQLPQSHTATWGDLSRAAQTLGPRPYQEHWEQTWLPGHSPQWYRQLQARFQ